MANFLNNYNTKAITRFEEPNVPTIAEADDRAKQFKEAQIIKDRTAMEEVQAMIAQEAANKPQRDAEEAQRRADSEAFIKENEAFMEEFKQRARDSGPEGAKVVDDFEAERKKDPRSSPPIAVSGLEGLLDEPLTPLESFQQEMSLRDSMDSVYDPIGEKQFADAENQLTGLDSAMESRRILETIDPSIPTGLSLWWQKQMNRMGMLDVEEMDAMATLQTLQSKAIEQAAIFAKSTMGLAPTDADMKAAQDIVGNPDTQTYEQLAFINHINVIGFGRERLYFSIMARERAMNDFSQPGVKERAEAHFEEVKNNAGPDVIGSIAWGKVQEQEVHRILGRKFPGADISVGMLEDVEENIDDYGSRIDASFEHMSKRDRADMTARERIAYDKGEKKIKDSYAPIIEKSIMEAENHNSIKRETHGLLEQIKTQDPQMAGDFNNIWKQMSAQFGWTEDVDELLALGEHKALAARAKMTAAKMAKAANGARVTDADMNNFVNVVGNPGAQPYEQLVAVTGMRHAIAVREELYHQMRADAMMQQGARYDENRFRASFDNWKKTSKEPGSIAWGKQLQANLDEMTYRKMKPYYDAQGIPSQPFGMIGHQTLAEEYAFRKNAMRVEAEEMGGLVSGEVESLIIPFMRVGKVAGAVHGAATSGAAKWVIYKGKKIAINTLIPALKKIPGTVVKYTKKGIMVIPKLAKKGVEGAALAGGAYLFAEHFDLLDKFKNGE